MTVAALPRPGDWSWLEGTYWYCPAECMPAIQAQRDNTFVWTLDQTVWYVSGYEGGYFWGTTSALITPVGDEPDPSSKMDSTFFASVTPEGQVFITFVQSAVSTTTGIGRMTSYRGEPSFAMQMSSGPGVALLTHWAYMLQVTPADPEWESLPGAGISVEEMVGCIEPPEPVPPEGES